MNNNTKNDMKNKNLKIKQNVKMETNTIINRIKSPLRDFYYKEVIPKMMKDLNYKNKHQVPRINKVVLSMGLGKRDVQKNVTDLTLIAGQKALVTKAKKSVSQFNVREGHDNGAKVTIRKHIMFNFLHRLRNIVLLNLRTFQGLFVRSINVMKKNLCISFGIKDKRIFPEVRDDAIRSEGLNITIVTNCRTVKEMQSLLSSIGLPFNKG